MKAKRGRPKVSKTEYKGVLFAVRVAKPEADVIGKAIKESGLSKPNWHRRALLSAAEKQ